MREVQAATQRTRHSEVDDLPDIQSAADLGMSNIALNTKKGNSELSMGTKAKHESSAQNHDIAEPGSSTVEGSLRLNSEAEIEVVTVMTRAAIQRLREASASDSQDAKLLHGTKPFIEKSSPTENLSAIPASITSQARARPPGKLLRMLRSGSSMRKSRPKRDRAVSRRTTDQHNPVSPAPSSPTTPRCKQQA